MQSLGLTTSIINRQLEPPSFDCQDETTVKLEYYISQLFDNTLIPVYDDYYPDLYLPTFGSVNYNQRIKDYVRNLKSLKTASMFGDIIVADYKTNKDFFIVKTPKDPKKDDLKHELFVGLYGINKLKKLIPNFVYTYGALFCGSPIIDKDNNQVVNFCSKSNKNVVYLLLENIKNSISMRDYIKTCTFNQWLEVYLQVIGALRLAKKECDFTHYDLHDGNVLIQTLDQPITIDYGDYKITTTTLAVIIDYGFSHIQYNNEHFGTYGRNDKGIFPDRSFILYDYYELLMACYEDKKNEDLNRGLQQIFLFFNNVESIKEAFDNQINNYFALPYLPEVDIDSYIKYVLSFYQPQYIPSSTLYQRELDLLEHYASRPTIPDAGFDYVHNIQATVNEFNQNKKLIDQKLLEITGYVLSETSYNIAQALNDLLTVLFVIRLYERQKYLKDAIDYIAQLYTYKVKIEIEIDPKMATYLGIIKENNEFVLKKHGIRDLKQRWHKAYGELFNEYI